MVKELNQLFAAPYDAQEGKRSKKIIVGETDPAVMVTNGRNGPWLGDRGACATVGTLANGHGGASENSRGAFAGVEACRN